MKRLLLTATVVLVGLVLLGAAAALLAYGPEPQTSGTLSVTGLESEATLSWDPASGVTIRSDQEPALWTGLGYAHAADHAWAMSLWRRAALGSLSGWVGVDALELDRHARQLGFGAIARETYAALEEADREAVDAYARGVRLAFEDAAVAERDEFVRMGVEIAPWEPWHALAVERLVAWLGSPAVASGESPAQDAFAQADSLFRNALALGGFEHARAYTANTRDGVTLVSHHPYGSSALPLLVGATLDFNGRSRTVATVPGTLILASGASAWSVFLTSPASVVPDTSLAPPPVFSRLVDRDGDETLIQVLRDRQGLLLRKPEEAPTDTLAVDARGEPVVSQPTLETAGLRLRWTGFMSVSDVSAFRALLRGSEPTFRLFNGHGLRIANGRVAPLGTPPVFERDTSWTFAGGDATSALAIPRLATLADQRPSLSPEAFALDTGSPWSAREAWRLVRALGNRDSLRFELQDAYAFLRGWDGFYRPTAVAPTIAEAWIQAQRDVFGREGDPRQRADSLLWSQTFRLSLATLRDSLGAKPGGWTWDHVNGELRYPFLGGLSGTYAPVASNSGGHPSALLPSHSSVLPSPPGPAVFSLWTSGDGPATRRPLISRGAPRDGRDPVRIRFWRSASPEASLLRLVPAR